MSDILESNTENNDHSPVRSAMYYGLVLGLFWILKYILSISNFYLKWGILMDFSYVLGILSLFLIYFFIRRYYAMLPASRQTMGQCVWFSVLMCFFASFFEAIAMYVHYIADPNFFGQLSNEMFAMFNSTIHHYQKANPLLNGNVQYESMLANFTHLLSLKIFYVVCAFIDNVIIGLVIGFISSLFIKKRNR